MTYKEVEEFFREYFKNRKSVFKHRESAFIIKETDRNQVQRAEEIKNTLQNYVNETFKEGIISSKLVKMIIKTSQRLRNLYYGIETLRISGLAADNIELSIITTDLVREVRNDLFLELSEEIFCILNTHELYAELGIAKELAKTSMTAITLSEA